MIKQQNYRDEFPNIHEGWIYLNHAAISPLPDRTKKAINRHLTFRQAGGIENFEHDHEITEQAREKVRQLLNAGSADEIAFTGNTTDGLNLIANGFPFEPGDRVLIHPHEFPTNQYPWLNQRQRGVEIDYLPENSGRITAEAVSNHIKPETKILAISAVQFLSGWKSDLKTITQICHEKGVLVIVDGIQALGSIPVDVTDTNVDAWSNGGHKWLFSPQGIGFVYMKPELRNRIRQTVKGWLSVKEPWDMFNLTQPLDATSRRYESGMPNLPGIYGLNESLGMLLEVGSELIFERIRKFNFVLRPALEVSGFSAYTSADKNYESGILTFRTPENTSSAQIVAQLANKKVVTSERDGMICFSLHFYNTEHEAEKTLDHLLNLMRAIAE